MVFAVWGGRKRGKKARCFRVQPAAAAASVGEDPETRGERDGRPAARGSPRPAAGDAVPGAKEAGGQGGGGGGGAADAGGGKEEEDGGGEARREEEAVRRDPAAPDAVAGGAVPAHAAAAARLLRHGDQRPPRGRRGHQLHPRAGGRRLLLRHRVRAGGHRRVLNSHGRLHAARRDVEPCMDAVLKGWCLDVCLYRRQSLSLQQFLLLTFSSSLIS